MEILLILFLLIFIAAFLYLIFRVAKWVLNSKIRKKWALYTLSFFFVVTVINEVFLKKMEFIQSKVYPNLYLVKNPISDQDSLNEIIKTIVLNKLDNGFVSKNENVSLSEKKIQFYEYTTAWGFDNGTKHFIENEEDPGGFSSEVLNNYYEYQLAYFSLKSCRNDSLNYIGNLILFKDGYIVKTNTLINLCRNE